MKVTVGFAARGQSAIRWRLRKQLGSAFSWLQDNGAIRLGDREPLPPFR